MKAEVIHVIKKDTREGKPYYKNAIIIDGRFGKDLATASSNKDYTAYIGTENKLNVFWYKDHYCIEE